MGKERREVETRVNEEEHISGEQMWEPEQEWEEERRDRQRERQTKLGHVTWLGLTAGRIKYPPACGHLHNKCSFHFINYLSSTGTEARHRKREAAAYSGWQPRLFSENKSGALKTLSSLSHRDGKQSGSLRYRENDHNRRKHGSSVWWRYCARLIALSICMLWKSKGWWNP